MKAPQTPSMDRDASVLPATPPALDAVNSSAGSGTKLTDPINISCSKLSNGRAHSTWVGGLSVLCGILNGQEGISIDTSQLPKKLVVILNCSTRSMLQFWLFTGCLPGLFGVLFNCAGSVDELHFEKQHDGSINMTRIRRYCSKIVTDRAIKVQAVGHLDDNESGDSSESGSQGGLGSNSNSDSPTNSNNEQKHVENLVVIDGATGAKIKEDHLIVNGNKLIKSTFHTTSIDAEGDASTLIKAFCNFPLSYEEYSWVEEVRRGRERERCVKGKRNQTNGGKGSEAILRVHTSAATTRRQTKPVKPASKPVSQPAKPSKPNHAI